MNDAASPNLWMALAKVFELIVFSIICTVASLVACYESSISLQCTMLLLLKPRYGLSAKTTTPVFVKSRVTSTTWRRRSSSRTIRYQ